MNNQEIVSKLWNLCNVLRDDGITYQQYVTELTYILFLKMCKETGTEGAIPEDYRWDKLVSKQGLELKQFYKELLEYLGTKCHGRVREIYQGAQTNIAEPKNLEKIIVTIDQFDWYSAKEEGLGNLYEGLLEKNATEKKSGAGQYFTPRVLIDVMTRLIAPKPGERCNDPACGTFGFMIAADQYVKSKTDNLFDLSIDEQEFQRTAAFTGCELVHDTHRLALMNAMLHDISGQIYLGDTLSNEGKQLNGYDVVLTNPPFGTKKGGERATRDDFTYPTSNKQLNFLQHIYRSLKADGKARAAVVLPDNVLFADGDGTKIRHDLMEKCNLHTVLRLPTGIFYAQGVKTNVLFFTRGEQDRGNTQEVWFYDLRTNMPSFGKTTPLTVEHFNGFEKAYTAADRRAVQDERWSVFTRAEIEYKGDTLDLGLIRDDSVLDYTDLPDPIERGEGVISTLADYTARMTRVITKLNEIKQNQIDIEKNICNTKLAFDENLEQVLVPVDDCPYRIPDNWCWVRIGSILNLQAGKNINAKKIHSIQDDVNKYPCFGGNGIRGYVKNYNNAGEYPIIGRQGALCGNLNYAQGQFYATEHAVVVTCPHGILARYAYYALNSMNLNQYATATAQPGLAVGTINKVPMVVPPIDEQQRIVNIIEELFSELNAIDAFPKQIDLMKKSILADAFRGKLGTNDPADTPATELLKEILS